MEGAWLTSLGYSFRQQERKWAPDTTATYSSPVGAEVSFFCSDGLKRPRKDEWDSDSGDGIITAICYHRGEFSITMNPAGEE